MTLFTLGYFADGPWSHRALERLERDPTLRIAFICARSDRPDPYLRVAAERLGVPFYAHPRVNSDEFIDTVRPSACDLFVSMSFNQIFRARLAGLPRLQTVNCHAGKLPFYRGRNILNWVLINDETTFGITVHHVDEGIDTGDIILQESFPITDSDTYATLLERAYVECGNLLYRAIKNLQHGTADRIDQGGIHPVGLYCSARRIGDEILTWNQPSRDVFNFVRAICRPGPEARSRLGEQEIRINSVQLVPDAPVFKGIPGAVLGTPPGGVLVKTADSFVKITEYTGVDRLRVGDRLT